MNILENTKFSDMEIVKMLSFSDSESVFEVVTPNNVSYVIKVIDISLIDDSILQKYMKITHPNLCTPIDFEYLAEKCFLLFKYLTPLTDYIAKNGLDLNQLLHLGIHITSGLVGLNHEHLFHGDIRPSNILVDEGNYVLCDFNYSGIYHPDKHIREYKTVDETYDTFKLNKMFQSFFSESTEPVVMNLKRHLSDTCFKKPIDAKGCFKHFQRDKRVPSSNFLFTNSDDASNFLYEKTLKIPKNNTNIIYKKSSEILLNISKIFSNNFSNLFTKLFEKEDKKISTETTKIINKTNQKPEYGFFVLWGILVVIGSISLFVLHQNFTAKKAKYNEITSENFAINFNEDFNENSDEASAEFVDLSNLKITEISDEIISNDGAPSDTISEFYLSNNKISNIDYFKDNQNIRVLSISENPISEIDELSTCSNLTILDISNTKVTDILSLYYLKNINLLNILNCKIPMAEIEDFKQNHPDCEVIY